ncbi:MAG: hypothetical protein Q9190_002678 [Brigantiaea leucoxantha]
MLAPKRKNIIYDIPGSTITLDMILNESKQMTPSLITTLLADANQKASNFPLGDIVEGVFKWETPDAKAEQGRKAEFGIAGGPIVNELTWRDVCIILPGLKGWYEQEQEWVSVLFYFKDRDRGEMGDGTVEPIKESANVVET